MELQKVEEKNYSHNFPILSAKKSFIFDGVKKGQGESKFFYFAFERQVWTAREVTYIGD